MKKWLVPTAVLASIFAAASPAVAAPSGPPITVDGPASFMNCGFLVTGDVTGKAKNFTTPSGDIISTSPGLKVTLTGPSGKTVKLVITGVLFFSFPSENVVEVKATGNNLLQLPSPDGLILTRGNVNFPVDSLGNELRRFSGSGTAVNVCPLLAR